MTGSQGLWFVSGVAALLLGNLLITPHFTSPVNALSYAVAVLLAIALLPPESPDRVAAGLYVVACSGTAAIAALGLLAIAFRDSPGERSRKVASAANLLLQEAAQPKVLFVAVLLYAIWQFHRDSTRETVLLSTAGLLIVGIRPFERGDLLLVAWRRRWAAIAATPIIGEIASREHPGIAIVRIPGDRCPPPGSLWVCKGHGGESRALLVLDDAGRHEGTLVRTLWIELSTEEAESIAPLVAVLPSSAVIRAPDELTEMLTVSSQAVSRTSDLVGIVAPDTTGSTLEFDVFEHSDLEIGQLVEAIVGEHPVLYQVIDCKTREEAVAGRNRFAFPRATAQRVGIWDYGESRFRRATWLPAANTPVLRAPTVERSSSPAVIGTFPGSDFTVRLTDLDRLVTHNTAILGVLGIGKTYLALELVERLLLEGVKVVCLDVTDEYKDGLADYGDEEADAFSLQALDAAAHQNQDVLAENPEEGGSFGRLRGAILSDLAEFLESDRLLKIYNPAKLTATKQVRELSTIKKHGEFTRVAGLWQVSPVEITRAVAEGLLELVSTQFREKAFVCLVLEEAHVLVPEWNTIAEPADQAATACTARAILQGRKYGYGCIAISQRTANVTKTILNQCNTMFTMRSFDDTSHNFVSNYIGTAHAKQLPELRQREAVLFGPCFSSDDPVRVRLNDRGDFRRMVDEKR